jgi:hypothetical protein
MQIIIFSFYTLLQGKWWECTEAQKVSQSLKGNKLLYRAYEINKKGE